MKMLGKGNHGAAYLMPDGRVRKETNDWREYKAAQVLTGLNLPHIVRIDECQEYLDEDGEKHYAIIEERLLMGANGIGPKRKDRFMSCFKLSWADYFYKLPHSSFERVNYVDFMFHCIRTENQKQCQNVFRCFKQRTHSTRMTAMYHATCAAIITLYQQSPFLEIDMNSGNIGFSADGQMKFFDIVRTP